jgi:hypothetical protein
MGIVLVWFRSVVLAGIDATTIGGSFLAVVLSSALFLIVLLVAGYGLKISQIDELIRKIINKLKLTKS